LKAAWWTIPLSITVAITLANDVFKADLIGRVAPKATTTLLDLSFFLTKAGFFFVSSVLFLELLVSPEILPCDPSFRLVAADSLDKLYFVRVRGVLNGDYFLEEELRIFDFFGEVDSTTFLSEDNLSAILLFKPIFLLS